jgi:hypothetical protein
MKMAVEARVLHTLPAGRPIDLHEGDVGCSHMEMER